MDKFPPYNREINNSKDIDALQDEIWEMNDYPPFREWSRLMSKYTKRRKRREQLLPQLRATANYSTIILVGAITARLVMMTIDSIVARNGEPPGGELALLFYAALLPICGWLLRGAWDRAKTAYLGNKMPKRR